MEKTVAAIMLIFSFLITCVVNLHLPKPYLQNWMESSKIWRALWLPVQLGIYKSVHRVALFQIVKTGAKENLIESEYLKKSFLSSQQS